MQLYKSYSPVVSIIIPAYNRAEKLERAIQSILNQTYKNWELIVVDDGSLDESYKIVKNFVIEHEKIRYAFHKNRGVTLTMNVGMKMSIGKYITFLGSDDEYKPEHLALRVEYLDKNPTIDLLHGGAEIIGERFVKDKNDLTKMIDLNDCILGGTLFGKSEIFQKINGFRDKSYSGESDLIERAEKICKIEKVNFPTYIYYRDDPNSITNSVK
jgi:glycosyltransferase involved in cell wall biosynthesis